MISGRETMTCAGIRACAMKSMTFSLMVLLNVVQSHLFNCKIYTYHVHSVFMLLPRKSESISRSMWGQRHVTINIYNIRQGHLGSRGAKHLKIN